MSDTRHINIGDIQSLAFYGAGIIGPNACSGAYAELLQQPSFSLEKITSVFGASSGGICALGACLFEELQDITGYISGYDTSQLAGKRSYLWSLHQLFYQAGTHSNSALRKTIEDIIYNRTQKRDMTFGELKKITGKDLYIFAAVLCNTQRSLTTKLFVFSPYHTENTSVVSAILSSTAILGYFPYIRLEKTSEGNYVEVQKGGSIFFDAAAFFPSADVLNNADQILKKKHGSDFHPGSVLAFRMQSGKKSKLEITNNLSDYHPISIFLAVLYRLLYDLRYYHIASSGNEYRTIPINSLGMSMVDFEMGANKKAKLFESGAEAAHRFFNPDSKSPHKTPKPNFVDTKLSHVSYASHINLILALASFVYGWKHTNKLSLGLLSGTLSYLATDAISDQINQHFSKRI